MSKQESADTWLVPNQRAMSGKESAALLLMLFDDEEAAEILTRLEPGDVENVGAAMFAVSNVTEKDVNMVLDRFVQLAASKTPIGFRHEPRVEAMISHALGSDIAANILNKVAPPKTLTRFERLKWMKPSDISILIAEEPAQIIAVLLSQLTSETAASVVQHLPEYLHDDIIFRLATLGDVSAAAMSELEQIFGEATTPVSHGAAVICGGTGTAAALLNNLPKPLDSKIIKALKRRDKSVAGAVEEQMFIFDDLIGLDDMNLGTLLRSVDNDILVLALKSCEAELADRIFGCMSSRAAQSVQDEIQDRGPVPKEDVIGAQKDIVAIARRLADEGTIILGGQGNDFV